jgi:cytochrome b
MVATIRVWDLPTRLFHWLLVACVIGSVVTGKIGGGAIHWHARLGYAVLALLLFRLVWGLVGGHWSRFASFTYSPASLYRQLRGQSPPKHRVGHSPLGAVSVFAMLGVLMAQVGTGLISDDEISFTGALNRLVSTAQGLQATAYHKQYGQWLVVGLVALHLGAVLYYLLRKHDNLILPMFHGNKQAVHAAAPHSRDTVHTRALAAVIFSTCAAAVFWLVR